MADFVGDAPAKQAVVTILAGDGHGAAAHQPGGGAPAHAHMAAGGVHEGPGEHAHVADILAGGHGIAVAGHGGAGGDDALDLVGHKQHILPGQHVLVHGVHHLFDAPVGALQPGQRLGGGDGQQHAGGGDLGGIADISLGRGRVQRRHIGFQLGYVGADSVFARGLVHTVPAGQLQHRHGKGVGIHPDLEPDLFRIGPGVGQVQRAAPLRVQGADLGHGDVVAAVHQPDRLALPDAGLAEELGKRHIHRRVGGQLGVDGHRGPGPGGHAQGLESAGGLAVLAVLAAVPALEAALDRTQGGGIARQQRLGQLQLVPQPGQIQIEIGLGLQPGGEGADLLPRHAGLEGGKGSVGKQRGDILRQAVALIEGHLGDAHPAAVPLPLIEGDGQGLDPLHRGEGQHQIVLLDIHGGGVVQRLAEQRLPIAVLRSHGVGAKGILVVSAQVGHQDDIIHVLGLGKGIGEVAVQAPVLGHPVGGRVAVHHLVNGKAGAQLTVYIVGVCHDHRLHQSVIDAVLLGQLGHDQLLTLGRAGGSGGVRACSPAVARLHRHLVGYAVGQAGDGGGGNGQIAAVLGKGALARLAVEHLIIRRVLGLAPAQAQGLVGGGYRDVRGRAGDAARLRRGGYHIRGHAPPVAVDGGDPELVGFQVLQPGDRGPGGVGGHLLIQLASGAVFNDIAGDIVHRSPLQGYLAVAGGGRQILNLVVFRAFGHNVLQEFNVAHHGIAGIVLGCGDGDGDLFHRHLSAQINGDHPLPRGAADSMNPLGEGNVKGNGAGGAAGILHHGLSLLDCAGSIGTGNLDFAHLHRAPAKVNGEGDGAAAAFRSHGDGSAALEQPGGIAIGKFDAGGVHMGGNNGGRIIRLGLVCAPHVMAGVGQVGDIHLAVPIEVVGGGAPAQVGVYRVQVGAVDFAVPVHIAQGEGAVPGARNQVLGIAVQPHGLGKGFISRPGELHPVLLPGGQAGELHHVIAHPALAVQGGAVHVVHLDRDIRGSRRQGNDNVLSAAGHMQLDVTPCGAVRRLGQVKPKGKAQGTGEGGRGIRRAGGGQARQAEGARHNQAERPGDQSSCCFHVCHSLLIAPTLCKLGYYVGLYFNMRKRSCQ